jgi:predicted amidohydrolase
MSGRIAAFDARVVQAKPRKGEFEANLAALGEVFAQLAAEPRPYDLIVLPEAALTGYFLEGAVYELALPAEALAERLGRVVARAGGATPSTSCCGFYENADGTYYNSALYLHVGGAGSAHPARAPQDVLADLRRVRRGALSLARPALDAFDTRSAPHGDADLRRRLARDHADDRRAQGRATLIVPSASPGADSPATANSRASSAEALLRAAMPSEHGVYIFYAGLTGFEGGKGMSGSSRIVGRAANAGGGAGPRTRASCAPSSISARSTRARESAAARRSRARCLPDLWFDEALPLPRVIGADLPVD